MILGSTAWSLSLMAISLPTMFFAALLLVRHLNESHDPAERTRAGISDALVRCSVGIEHPDDLLADFEAALS